MPQGQAPKNPLPPSPNTAPPDVYEPESLKKARKIPALTEAQARAREQRANRGGGLR